jgi:hypothetical protein
MNAIRSVFSALSNLASSFNGLAAVIDQARERLSQQLALDGEPAPALEHQGEILEHAAATNGTGKRRSRS